MFGSNIFIKLFVIAFPITENMFGSYICIELFVIAFPITENMFGSYICIELFVIAFSITENVIYEIKSSCKEVSLTLLTIHQVQRAPCVNLS